MPEDNMYPNAGNYFTPTEPNEQKAERDKEKAEVYEALPVIERTIAHFDERIKARDSLSSIDVDLSKDPAMHQKLCAVNELLKMALVQERDLLIALLEEHVEQK
jgi:hypothetical protein